MITTKALSFGYSAKKRVLNDISLELGEGHIHGLLGCNGIGKTTLLKLVCGIMRPDEGEVLVDGVDPMTRCPENFSELMIIPEEFDLPNISLERYANDVVVCSSSKICQCTQWPPLCLVGRTEPRFYWSCPTPQSSLSSLTKSEKQQALT